MRLLASRIVIALAISGLLTAPVEAARIFRADQLTFLKGVDPSVAAASSCTPLSGNVLWIDPSDRTSMFQTIAGSTAVTADGDVVGTANDKSGNGFHLTAVADTSVRPTSEDAGGLYWLRFDGTDILKRGAFLGLANAAHTIVIGVRHDAAAQGSLITEKNVADPEVEYRPLRNLSSDFNDIQGWLRQDDGTYRLNNVLLADEGFPTTTNVSVIITNSTTSIQAYIDGTAQTAQSFTAFSGTNPDTFGLGGNWRTTASDIATFDLTYLRIYNRVLNSTEIAAEDVCVKASQGR